MKRLLVEDNNPGARSPACYYAICGAATRERKPYCSEHVLEEPYPRRLAQIIAGAEREVANVAKRGAKAVNVDGLIVEEILDGLRTTGQITWRRLLKDRITFLNSTNEVVTGAYLQRLLAEKLVVATVNQRRATVVTLTKKGLARAQS